MGTERLLALATEADRNSWGGALLLCRVAKLEISVNICYSMYQISNIAYQIGQRHLWCGVSMK